MKKPYFIIIAVALLIQACQAVVEENKESVELDQRTHLVKGDSIVELSIASHGGDRYDKANIEFVFRDKTYQFANFGKQYQYSRKQIINGDTILDVLSNDGFERIMNGYPIEIKDSNTLKYAESINSVIYFATLPYKLSDDAVIKQFKGQTKIKGQLYNAVEVSFNAEGGGKDHEDIFYYWFNAKTHQIDYLAYQYATNGGGVRFRSAYNKQEIGGILFQDYVNYEVTIGTPLDQIPELFEKGELKELSRIENMDIQIIQ